MFHIMRHPISACRRTSVCLYGFGAPAFSKTLVLNWIKTLFCLNPVGPGPWIPCPHRYRSVDRRLGGQTFSTPLCSVFWVCTHLGSNVQFPPRPPSDSVPLFAEFLNVIAWFLVSFRDTSDPSGDTSGPFGHLRRRSVFRLHPFGLRLRAFSRHHFL